MDLNFAHMEDEIEGGYSERQWKRKEVEQNDKILREKADPSEIKVKNAYYYKKNHKPVAYLCCTSNTWKVGRIVLIDSKSDHPFDVHRS